MILPGRACPFDSPACIDHVNTHRKCTQIRVNYLQRVFAPIFVTPSRKNQSSRLISRSKQYIFVIIIMHRICVLQYLYRTTCTKATPSGSIISFPTIIGTSPVETVILYIIITTHACVSIFELKLSKLD